MVVPGLILVLLTILFVSVQIVAHRWIKKVTNCYFFWFVIGAFWFIWLVYFRFANSWIAFTNYHFTNPGSYTDSIVISKAFLLDLCPFSALAMCVSFMLDPTRKSARLIAPMCLIGGMVTLISFPFDNSIGTELTAQFIFIGSNQENACYFIMHFLQIVLSVGALLNTPRCGWKGFVGSLLTAGLYYCYVGIVMATTGCRWNCTGLSINDWTPQGEYHFVSDITHLSPQVCQIIGIPILFMCGFAVVAIKDLIFDRGWFKYGNAYSNKWYLWYNYNKFVKQKIL